VSEKLIGISGGRLGLTAASGMGNCVVDQEQAMKTSKSERMTGRSPGKFLCHAQKWGLGLFEAQTKKHTWPRKQSNEFVLWNLRKEGDYL